MMMILELKYFEMCSWLWIHDLSIIDLCTRSYCLTFMIDMKMLIKEVVSHMLLKHGGVRSNKWALMWMSRSNSDDCMTSA